MSIQNWSENVIVVEAADDPQFTDDMDSLLAMVSDRLDQDVVVDLSPVNSINSSNIAKLLKLRKQVVESSRRKLRLCGVNTHVWGVLLMTGLDKVFEFADNVALGLASVQIENE
jgi:anti-anti-sigma factor